MHVFNVVFLSAQARDELVASPEEQGEAAGGLETGTGHLHPRTGRWPEQAVCRVEEQEKVRQADFKMAGLWWRQAF